MYSEFYGLTGRAFHTASDPAPYYDSASHRRALSCLDDGLAQGEGVLVLTGEAGVGKTTLVAQFVASIDRAQVTIAQIAAHRSDTYPAAAHPAAAHSAAANSAAAHSADARPADGRLPRARPQSDQTIPAVARAFGLADVSWLGFAADTRQPFLLDANLSFLRDEARAGRGCLLVVDDAQALPLAALETLRLMANFQLGDRPLLQILLVGQPALRHRLDCDPDLEALRQRVVASHQLDPLAADEVERYLHHRLKCAGWNGNPTFSAQLHAELYAATGGVPGRIDQIVDRLLRLGAARQKGHIDGTMLIQVLAAGDRAAPGDGQTGMVAGPEPAMPLQTSLDAALTRCEEKIAELQQAVVDLGDTGGGFAQAARHRQDNAALQERLGSLESRLIEQERTVRHTLTMLIEWIERDEARGVAA